MENGKETTIRKAYCHPISDAESFVCIIKKGKEKEKKEKSGDKKFLTRLDIENQYFIPNTTLAATGPTEIWIFGFWIIGF